MGYDPKEPRDKNGKWTSGNVVSIGHNAGKGNRAIADHIAQQHKADQYKSGQQKPNTLFGMEIKQLPAPMRIAPEDMRRAPDPSTWNIQRSRTIGPDPKDFFFVQHPDIEAGYGQKVMTGFTTKKAADDFINAARRNKK